MKKNWHLQQPDPATINQLSRNLKCHPITAAVLINRRILSAADATNFLNVSLAGIRSPFALADIDAAVARIFNALRKNEKILIFGDYDVDGITSTVILMDFFQSVGADASYYIPHRIKEGYSIQARHIDEIAVPRKVNLIITADCGSASFEAVARARRLGIDIIITDHHHVSEKLPPAVAVINPQRHDCDAGLEHLAGVGVAYYLLICLRKFLRDKDFWQDKPEPNLKKLCDLVALGTISDIVPLIHENRIFTKTGIGLIRSKSRPGITALLEVAGISKEFADSDDLAFRLAPRLNAAGRMDHASRAVKLLSATNSDEARQLAQSLDDLNRKRQELERSIIDHILADLAKNQDAMQKNTLVFWNSHWHQGVLGIVASRLVERYYRPAVLLAAGAETARGSARSIPEIDLHACLSACDNVLDKFGGHKMAAGLSLKIENLVSFREQFENAVGHRVSVKDLTPDIEIDAEIHFKDISEQLMDELEALAPFGNGNSEPLFMARNLMVSASKIVGKNHRQMVLKQPTGSPDIFVNAIHFNIPDANLDQKSFDRLAFRLRWNYWNGRKKAQIIVEHI
jgi:single-stranded-DNA-specific exonuclease